MVAGVRRGDTIVTSGGIIGKVAKVDEQELQVEIAEGVKIKALRSTISEVRGKGRQRPLPRAKPKTRIRTRKKMRPRRHEPRNDQPQQPLA